MGAEKLQRLLGSVALALSLTATPLLADDWAAAGDDWGDEWEDETESRLPFRIGGFIEAAGGIHLYNNKVVDGRLGKNYNLGETRLRLDIDGDWKSISYSLKADGVADGVDEELRAELREALISTSTGAVDWRVGRQILTWGTGDLLFINDLFPKDWQSFLIGRDEDYLKGASDAIRTTWYAEAITLDLVWSPIFTADNYPDGDRLSYWGQTDQGLGLTAQPVSDNAREPSSFPGDGEVALRLATRQAGIEYALYGYWGYWPQPNDARKTLAGGRLEHPALHVYGASLRTGLGAGLFNAEVGYYDSRDYDSKQAALTPNSEVRFLMGYDWELVTNLNVGVQYYLEWTLDHDEQKAAWDQMGEGYMAGEEYRQLLTTRLTYTQMRGDLMWSLFAFMSPSDDDFYLRPSVRYRVSDDLTISAGGNLFGGKKDYSFFGQFEKDTNAYLRARYRF